MLLIMDNAKFRGVVRVNIGKNQLLIELVHLISF